MNRAVFDDGNLSCDEAVEAAWVVVDDDIIAVAESKVEPI